ncbi:MAG: hypothetical protein FJX72_07970, partial [Armatimonadetes bacterium]|nr:hypothetical protein [Armatimonadota bacterium]
MPPNQDRPLAECDAGDLLGACAEAYDIGSVRRTEVLRGGMFLQPRLIETDRGRFVLRAHTFRNEASSFRFQAETIEYAAEHGFPCPRVLRRRDGRWGVRREGAFWALHEYADGDVLNWYRWCALKCDTPSILG